MWLVTLIFAYKSTLGKYKYLIIILLLICLVIQTFWLLPELGKRLDVILANGNLERSIHHSAYIITEISKTLILIISVFYYTLVRRDKYDNITIDNIKLLVDNFYSKISNDPDLGPIFAKVLGSNTIES